MKMKKWISWLMVVAMAATLFGAVMPVSAAGEDTSAPELSVTPSGSYGAYLAEHGQPSGENRPDDEIVIDAAQFVSMEDCQAYLTSYMGQDNVLYWDKEGGTVTWKFRVEQEGYYQMAITYCAIAGKNYDMVMDVYLDGQIPYSNAQNINLHRKFIDETYFGLDDNAFETNLNGDELRPNLVEQFDWQIQTVTDAKSQYPGPLYFYLTKGEHTVSLGLDEEYLAIRAITFRNTADVPSYADVLSTWNARDTENLMLTFEAEKSYIKNNITLFATYDTAYCHVTPASASSILYNTIGKNTWKEIGQEITWEFEVPEDGYYEMAFKVKQNTKSNSYSVRSVSIDGAPLYLSLIHI